MPAPSKYKFSQLVKPFGSKAFINKKSGLPGKGQAAVQAGSGIKPGYWFKAQLAAR